MKFVSDDGKIYDTREECESADEKFKQAQLAKVETEKKKSAVSKQKKLLADKIDAAEKALDLATKNWQKAKEEAYKIRKEAEEKAVDLIYEAAKEREKAASDKMEAIAAFNKAFGPYSKTVTEEKAEEEYANLINNFNDLLYLFGL